MNGVCLEDSLVNRMPNSNGLVESKPVIVLSDTACSGVIEKKDLIKKEQLTGNIGYAMTVERTLLKSPFENIRVSTPYFSGIMEVFCPKNFSNRLLCYELIIENIFASRAPKDPDKT